MKNFFDLLQDKIALYKASYENKPNKACAHLALWAFKGIFKRYDLPYSDTQVKNVNPDVLHIAIAEGGGMGDASFQITYIKEIRKMFTKPVVIDFYCRAYNAFQNFPFIDNCYPYTDSHDTDKYDVYIVSRRFYSVIKIDEEKTKRFSEKFYDFCKKSIFLRDVVLENKTDDNLFSQYGLIFGRNRVEQADVYQMIPVSRYTPTYLKWSDDSFSCIKDFNLCDEDYITISRAVDSKYATNHPKLWPIEYFDKLVKLIKSNYKNIKIVQVGASEDFGIIKGIDVNLVGKTNLEQLKVVLKYSKLHIDCEGGLVHLRHLLNGKSIVIFGPTSPDIFGYEDNVNLRSKVCPHPCEWVTCNWTKGCLLGESIPLCMQKLTPEDVFKEVKCCLDNVVRYDVVCSYDKEISVKSKQKLAVFGKINEKLLNILQAKTDFITIYANDLSDLNGGYNKNMGYLEFAKKNKINADFATPYNIPAKDGEYDVMYISDLDNVSFIEYALQEAFRILKNGGKLYIDSNYASDLKNICKINELKDHKSTYVCLIKQEK